MHGENIEPFGGESCLKPIGGLAQAIEKMPMEDFLLWMVGGKPPPYIVEAAEQTFPASKPVCPNCGMDKIATGPPFILPRDHHTHCCENCLVNFTPRPKI